MKIDRVRAFQVTGRADVPVIEERGARLLYLPPYSPDLNPIEHAFAKVKQVLLRAGARTIDALAAAAGSPSTPSRPPPEPS